MKFLFLKGLRYKAIYRELSAVLDKGAASAATVKRWCKRFKDRNFCLEDETRPGRPKSDLAKTISLLLEKEPFLSARTLANKLASSREKIRDVLENDLGLRKFTRRWVPHELTPAQMAQRVFDSILLAEALRADEKNQFRNIMTGDESWFYYQYESDAMYAHSRNEVIPRVSKAIDSKKCMVTIFFTGERLLNLAQLPRGQKYNGEYFVKEILEDINATCNQGAGYRHTKHMSIHMDNCRVHNSEWSTAVIQRLKLTRLPHPPYSPDISPCDFWFFGRAKGALQNRTFIDATALLEALTELWMTITLEELQSVFQNWIKRLDWVIQNGGKYFPK
jgi:histone-lysine N-methyltransferase SETMAR